MKAIIAAGALALAIAAAWPAAALGAAPVIQSGSRVLKLCLMEDPSCAQLVRESYDRVQGQSRCPDGTWLPPDIAVRAWTQMGPQMIAVGPDEDIDWSMGSAISTIDPSHCVPR